MPASHAHEGRPELLHAREILVVVAGGEFERAGLLSLLVGLISLALFAVLRRLGAL